MDGDMDALGDMDGDLDALGLGDLTHVRRDSSDKNDHQDHLS